MPCRSSLDSFQHLLLFHILGVDYCVTALQMRANQAVVQQDQHFFIQSANISIQLVTTSGMSIIILNSTNIVGLHCGTPEITLFNADVSSFITTICLRSDKKCLHHPSIVPVIANGLTGVNFYRYGLQYGL